jgi:bifunctional UDP-N-acetylglucosamine pyrophosphorylase/glucosamine-1-phosphate N-acetyltransferase
MTIKTIILAAGQGSRMRSKQPKVLHTIAGKSLLEHVCETSFQLDNNQVFVVYGQGGETVKTQLSTLNVGWIKQALQLGTGHAVQQAITAINDNDTVLILYGDVPLLKTSTLETLLAQVSERSLGLLTVNLANPTGYGRIVRDANQQVIKIVEQKDASASELQINEGNTGILATKGGRLKNWLSRLENNNAQQEYYLTDVIAMAVSDGLVINTCQPDTVDEVLGVNNRQQLSHLERVYQLEQAHRLMTAGVTLRDPARIDVRGSFSQLGEDITIDINVIFEGSNRLGNNVTLGAHTIIKNSVIGDNVEILAYCMIDNAIIGKNSRIGPFARLRPQTELANNVHIGNFVELKKSTIAAESKINHLSYIGDSLVGRGVNIGAGTITCNYDGVNKSQTEIKDGAFIGSNTQLVAPITVGKNATIGAGSTLTKDAADEQLTLARAKQITLKSWQRPVKK